LVLESASVSYGKATPYFPVVDLLKRYVHVEDVDDPRTIRAKVTGQILTLDESLQETIPALLSLLVALPEDSPFLRLDPPQRRQRTLEGLKRIVLRESQVQPLLLVFEDLHWIDSETQALLDSLIESLPTAQLLLLVNYRPEYQHGWGSKTYYTQLRLDPLHAESADAFLEALLGDDPSLEPLKKLLIERTEGNPFFLEESVRTLVETQVLVGESGAYRLTQEIPTIQVPATVQAVLAARIDRLPQDVKRLLQTAAVIGTEVPFPLLQAIADVPEDVLHRGLTHLQAAEFLYETSLFPERIYNFKHGLTNEVAYGSLLQERRRVLHAQIVETLESLNGDQVAEQVERLAYHTFRGEMWDKAMMYFRQSGAKAMEQSAYREAVSCFEQALDALQHLPDSRKMHEHALALRLDLRNALVPVPLEEPTLSLDNLRQAERLAESLGDQHRLGLIACYLCVYFLYVADYGCAIATGQRALNLGTTNDDFDVQIMAQTYLGVIYMHVADYRQAMVYASQTTASLEGVLVYERFGGNPQPQASIARQVLTYCHAETGGFTEGIAISEEAIRIAEELGQPYGLASPPLILGFLYYRKGDLEQALPHLERSHQLCQDAISLLLPLATSLLGAVYALTGRLCEAQLLIDQGVAQPASETNKFALPFRLTVLSEALLSMNRVQEAHTLAVRLFDLVRTYPSSGYQAHALRLFAEIAAHRDPPDIDQAETHYQQALTLANELGMRPLQAHFHRGLGTVYSQTGQSEQARAELSTAIDLYRAMEMTFWLPQAEAALADVESR
jgi:tetratricopeptide (TPR) repeat protein